MHILLCKLISKVISQILNGDNMIENLELIDMHIHKIDVEQKKFNKQQRKWLARLDMFNQLRPTELPFDQEKISFDIEEID